MQRGVLGYGKNNGHREVYKRWIAEEPLVLPRYLQKKGHQELTRRTEENKRAVCKKRFQS